MKKALITAAVLVFAMAVPTLALGPVDVEVGAAYWVSETDVPLLEWSGDFDSKDLCFWGQIWVGKVGAKAAITKADVDSIEMKWDLKYTSLDIRYKILKLTDNNYIALGAGYQKVDWGLELPDAVDSSGWRLVAETRFRVGPIVSLYGEVAYYLSMDELEIEDIVLTDGVGGWEGEVGVSLKPFPFMNIRAGYRRHASDFDLLINDNLAPTQNLELTPEGFIVGMTVNF